MIRHSFFNSKSCLRRYAASKPAVFEQGEKIGFCFPQPCRNSNHEEAAAEIRERENKRIVRVVFDISCDKRSVAGFGDFKKG